MIRVGNNLQRPDGNGSSRRTPRMSQKRKEKADEFAARLGADSEALFGLTLVRTRVAEIVEAEKAILQEARHDCFRTCDKLGSRLKGEKETLHFIQSKVQTKQEKEDIMEQHEKAQEIIVYRVKGPGF